ncbi:hypothetical protein GCM10007385_45060 [Tateyamaria omphalii]|nr:hypothetical protein GCM10007385_45060 [Tateyamaria omphalii]
MQAAVPRDVVMVPFCVPELRFSDLQTLEEAEVGGLLLLANKLPRFPLKAACLPIFGLSDDRVEDGISQLGDPNRATPNPFYLSEYFVVADADGIVVVPGDRIENVMPSALAIRERKDRVFGAMCAGSSLRAQTYFPAFLSVQRVLPDYSFRTHLSLHGSDHDLL